MSMDGIVIRAVVHELQSCVGSRIHKIHQPTPHDLVVQIRGGSTPGKLLLSANPTYPRVHWTEAAFVNPQEAPMFCMLMRKYCEGAVIESITQPGRERVIHIDIRQRDELGDLSFKRIIVEIMGRHSNIILLDPATGTIHDGIHHVTPALSSYRVVMPGAAYTTPPEQNKIDPITVMTEEAFQLAWDQSEGAEAADKKLVASFGGVSPLLAGEIVHRAAAFLAGDSDPVALTASAVWPAFNEMMTSFREERYSPNIVTETRSGKSYFSATELTRYEGESTSYDSISACLEAYYGDKAERDTVKQRASDLLKFVVNEIAKNKIKLEKLKETIEEAKGADRYRVLGELLTAYMHSISKGDTAIEVINYYDEEQLPLTIELDPLMTPSENAQRYFRKYNKQKNSLIAVEEQIKITEAETAYFEQVLLQLQTAALQDLQEIRDELVEGQYLRDRGNKKGSKKKKPTKPSLLCYTSSEGIPIFVGKNNTQNEYLTNKLAASSDTWLHTKDIPGSHVVIRSESFGEATLQEAAMLAAYYSQARESSQVPVDTTLIRHVRKPNGAKPGFVIYDKQKTIFITPDEQRIRTLPHTVK
ncbi:putative ribosome quality control (RQC) complex YloA/Tae2 family protein [Paenibacillus cellulosilyticus]|uniref:Rqc2 homolog RqcH n=1 Tax=Paenibacillus cellulosilyticus TaxID=375489 RepID=A0A2V2YX66_9BACL|nr:NFACT RNA binding domain-containing protein [Paenibacillus cellulosilyticus]PWW06204.1 putative ribosome quality control (RQC) complex YloA/Tae2 family protein [Paenibacillus cellulosilyticus]QKS43034.1 fibronectin/fibrinogen-binding protein [Paenibacillus cellulosilyticus]